MGKTTRIGTSLIQIQRELGTEEQCLAFLEAVRWPDGVRCLKCDGDRISKFSTTEGTRNYKNPKTGKLKERRVPARHLYQCLNSECGHQFSATAGTIFNDSHLPLTKWMLATAIMCNARKGVSANQLQRDLEVSYKTAWYLSHRIREAMMSGNILEPFTGTVEADETYVGGTYNPRVKRGKYEKAPVVGFVQRGTENQISKVRANYMGGDKPNAWTVAERVRENVEKGTRLMTDESNLYAWCGDYERDVVKHIAKEWVRSDVYTNTVENFWSLFDRGLIGSYHKLSVKHLDRYLAEFCFRFNNRKNEELFVSVVLYLVITNALPYIKLVGKTPKVTPSDEMPFLGVRLRGISALGSGGVAISLRMTCVNCSRGTEVVFGR